MKGFLMHTKPHHSVENITKNVPFKKCWGHLYSFLIGEKVEKSKKVGALGFDCIWKTLTIMLENETCCVIFRHCEMR